MGFPKSINPRKTVIAQSRMPLKAISSDPRCHRWTPTGLAKRNSERPHRREEEQGPIPQIQIVWRNDAGGCGPSKTPTKHHIRPNRKASQHRRSSILDTPWAKGFGRKPHNDQGVPTI